MVQPRYPKVEVTLKKSDPLHIQAAIVTAALAQYEGKCIARGFSKHLQIKYAGCDIDVKEFYRWVNVKWVNF